MKRKKKFRDDAEIDMAPLIDMVFLLLIFFMCTATLSQVEFTPDVKLPVAPRAQVPEDLRNRGTISLLSDRIMIAGNVVSEKEMIKIMKLQREENPELKLYLRADKNVTFKEIKKVMRACADAGIYDIIFGSFQSPSTK